MLCSHSLTEITKQEQTLDDFCRNYNDQCWIESAPCNAWIYILGWIHLSHIAKVPKIGNVDDVSTKRWTDFKQKSDWHKKIYRTTSPHENTEAQMFQLLATHHFPGSLAKASSFAKNVAIHTHITHLEKEKNECLDILCYIFGPNSGRLALTKEELAKIQVMLLRYACILDKDDKGNMRRLTFLDILRDWMNISQDRKDLFNALEALFNLKGMQNWVQKSFTPAICSPVRAPGATSSSENSTDSSALLPPHAPPPLQASEQSQSESTINVVPETIVRILKRDREGTFVFFDPKRSTPLMSDQSFKHEIMRRTESALSRFRLKLSVAAIKKLMDIFRKSLTDTLRQDVFYFIEASEKLLNPSCKSERNSEKLMLPQERWELARETLEILFLPTHQDIYNLLETAFCYSTNMEFLYLKKYPIDLECPLYFFECLTSLSKQQRSTLWKIMEPLYNSPGSYSLRDPIASTFFCQIRRREMFTPSQLIGIFLNHQHRDFYFSDPSGKAPSDTATLFSNATLQEAASANETLDYIDALGQYLGFPLTNTIAYNLLVDAPIPLIVVQHLNTLEAWNRLIKPCPLPLIPSPLTQSYIDLKKVGMYPDMFLKNVSDAQVRASRKELCTLILQMTFMNPDCRLQLLRFPGLHQDFLQRLNDGSGIHWSSAISISNEFGEGIVCHCAWVPLYVSSKYKPKYEAGIYWIFEITMSLGGKAHTGRIPLKIAQRIFQEDRVLCDLFQRLVKVFSIENYDSPFVTPESYSKDPLVIVIEVLTVLGDQETLALLTRYADNSTECRELVMDVFQFLFEVKLKIRTLPQELVRGSIPSASALEPKQAQEVPVNYLRKGHLFPLVNGEGWSLCPPEHPSHSDSLYSLNCNDLNAIQPLFKHNDKSFLDPFKLIFEVQFGRELVKLEINLKITVEPGENPKWRLYQASVKPPDLLKHYLEQMRRNLDDCISIPCNCSEERAKEMVGFLLMRIKIRFCQLFYTPEEYQWFIPPKRNP